MNLHGIVRQAITAVNPDILATWQQSTGSTVSAGVLTPTYNTVTNVPIQVQGVNSRDLRHIEYLNLQGVLRKVYTYGNIEGVVRPNLQGGDLLTFPQEYGATPQVWLIVAVLEVWPDQQQSGWSSAIACLQTDVVVS